jgi:cobalt/nickel transport system ATP-binding protein
VLRRGTGQEVFGDAELIKTARLKLPTIVDLYQELAGRGLVNVGKTPLNILELCDLLESRTENKEPVKGKSRGKIYICNVDEDLLLQIPEILEETGADYTGAMGTSAKVMAEQSSIPLDFTYGVIDKCILKALTGKSSLIMTSGGMVDHALQRIEAYGRESGAEIAAVKIPSCQEGSMSI